MPYYVVMNIKPEHEFGAQAPPKRIVHRHGKALAFDTEAAAIEHARELNRQFRTRNLWYTVEQAP